MQYLFLQRRSAYPYSLDNSMRTFTVITCKALSRDAGDNAEPWRILPDVADRFTAEMASRKALMSVAGHNSHRTLSWSKPFIKCHRQTPYPVGPLQRRLPGGRSLAIRHTLMVALSASCLYSLELRDSLSHLSRSTEVIQPL